MKIKSAIFMSILLISCSSVSEHVKEADRIVNNFTKEVGAQDNLKLVGSGGRFMDDIKEISLNFNTVQNLDVSNARRLYVKTIEHLLQAVNNDSKIRPYLHSYPFTVDNVEVFLSFSKPNGERVDSQFVGLMFVVKNRIFYSTKINGKFQNLHEEPYAEALRIVQGVKQVELPYSP